MLLQDLGGGYKVSSEFAFLRLLHKYLMKKRKIHGSCYFPVLHKFDFSMSKNVKLHAAVA